MRDFESIASELKRLSERAGTPSRVHLGAVGKLIEAAQRGDFETVLADATDETTFEIFAPSELPFIRHATGKDAMLKAITANFEALDEQVPVLGKVFAEGDRVILFSRETGVVKSTGFRYDVEAMHWFTFRKERLVSVQITAAHARPVGVLVKQGGREEQTDLAK